MGRERCHGDNHKVRLPIELVDRLRPIVAQRRKDQTSVSLHTANLFPKKGREEDLAPSIKTLVWEAVEYWADMHVPIETTPPERLTGCGKRAFEYLPLGPVNMPKKRDEWLLKFAAALQKEIDKEKSKK